MESRKEELSKYLLQDLRKIGKEKGIKSPSTLSKSELIDQIISIENGITAPAFSSRGRPNKKRVDFSKEENTTKNEESDHKTIISDEKKEQILTLTKDFVLNLIKIINS